MNTAKEMAVVGEDDKSVVSVPGVAYDAKKGTVIVYIPQKFLSALSQHFKMF